MNTDDTITIYDVAREAGVSMATDSRVVNGNKNVKGPDIEKVVVGSILDVDTDMLLASLSSDELGVSSRENNIKDI